MACSENPATQSILNVANNCLESDSVVRLFEKITKNDHLQVFCLCEHVLSLGCKKNQCRFVPCTDLRRVVAEQFYAMIAQDIDISDNVLCASGCIVLGTVLDKITYLQRLNISGLHYSYSGFGIQSRLLTFIQ